MINLSVILINKNRSFSLERAIKAVIAQLKSGDEFIVVDDNSTDGSVDIIKKYEQHMTKFVQIESNGNRSRVRNSGAIYANNEIVVFVDGDVVIGPDNLAIAREIHKDKNIAGINGNVFGNDHDIPQFELMGQVKIEDFLKRLDEDFSVLYAYDKFFDYRHIHKNALENPKENWKHYFTSFATARKDIFDRIGGFDESIIVWGAEDMELAYRLNQHGDILFDERVVSFHYPHHKNQFNNATNNTSNMYYLLLKYQTHMFEVAMSYHMGFPEEYKKWVREIIDNLSKNNKNDFVIDLKQGEACLYFSDAEHKDGYVEAMMEDELKQINLFGLSLPLIDKSFDKVYISPYYSYIPESLLATILQEAIRISDIVLIPKKGKCVDGEIRDVLNGRAFYMYNEIIAIALKLKYFDFLDYDDEYFRVTLKPDAQFYVSKMNKYYSV